MGYKYKLLPDPEKAAYRDWQSGLRGEVMVIEVEVLLLAGRGTGTGSHGSALQLLQWQVELGQPWARGRVEVAEGWEGPAGFYPSLTHFAG